MHSKRCLRGRPGRVLSFLREGWVTRAADFIPRWILRYALVAVVLAGFSIPATLAADYYFSDCATGGQGTKASPWCLDPNSDGSRESVMYLFDGTAPEAAPGDTIHLCAGACDGSGSTTYHVAPTHSSPYYWFCSTTSGTSSQPITIQNYQGETVAISGDTNANGTYNSGIDVDNLITNACSMSIKYITWKGNNVGPSKGLILERSGGRMVTLDNSTVPGATDYYVGGPDGWVFDGLILRYVGGVMWGGGSFYAGGCYSGSQNHVFQIHGLTGPFTVKNSIIHSFCGFAHRDGNNNGGGGAFVFDGNEYYNGGAVSNDYLNLNPSGTRWATFLWQNNYIHDCQVGPDIEDRMRDIIIQDNVIACLGEYKLTADGRCEAGILIGAVDSDPGTTFNVTIRRNRIYQAATSASFSAASCPSSSCGWFLAAIKWDVTCNSTRADGCTTSNGLIENNFVWNHVTATGGDCEKGSICVSTNNDDVTIRNNTLYGGVRGISLLGSNRNYPVVNNVVSNMSEAGIWAASGTLSDKLDYNNIYGTSGTILNLSGTTFSCSAVAGFGTGNKCAASHFRNVSGSPDLWDIHLDPTDTANRGLGTLGPPEDIDRQPRPTVAADLGADQVGTPDSTPPSTPANLHFVN